MEAPDFYQHPLFFDEFFQVGQTLIHHDTIGIFIKHTSEFLPWIPFQLKIHIPLKGKRISWSMVHLPPIDHGCLTALAQCHNDGRIIYIHGSDGNGREFFCGILRHECRMPVAPLEGILNPFENWIPWCGNIGCLWYSNMRWDQQGNKRGYQEKKKNTQDG